jgi:hypothetical protein
MALGRYLESHAQPGDACIFQDMGAAPWIAKSVRFVDPIGIVDPTIARLTARFRLSPFLRASRASRPGGARDLARFDELARDYLLGRRTRWAAFVAYVPKPRRDDVARRFEAAEGDPRRLERLFAGLLGANVYAHGLTRDARFRRAYHLDRAWKRDDGYYLVLYERISPPSPQRRRFAGRRSSLLASGACPPASSTLPTGRRSPTRFAARARRSSSPTDSPRRRSTGDTFCRASRAARGS